MAHYLDELDIVIVYIYFLENRGASGPQNKTKTKKERNYVEPNFHNNKK